MLRMQPFDAEYPSDLNDALALLDDKSGEVRVCAGGTDLVPNIKHGLHEPQRVVHLARISKLKGIKLSETHLEIGAMTTLHELEHSSEVRARFPGLAFAASEVAGPQLRRMGTIGGNLCLDTRCLYYNQTYFWRESLGFCLKKDGTHCHVVDSGKKCVAAASNDVATMLLAMSSDGAPVEVRLQTSARDRWIPLDELYVADGIKNTILERGELLTAVRIPLAGDVRCGYAKLRHRASIDYPLLCAAVRFTMKGDVVEDARVVCSALAARAKDLNTSFCKGRALDDGLVAELAALGHKKINPLTNIADDPAWRKDMVPVLVEDACAMARSSGRSARGSRG